RKGRQLQLKPGGPRTPRRRVPDLSSAGMEDVNVTQREEGQRQIMMKNVLSCAVLSAALIGFATPAHALSITGGVLNTSVGSFSDTGVDSVNLIDVDGNNDDATAFLLLELAGNANINSFGIYGFTGSGNSVVLGDMLEVFSGSASAVTSQTIRFDVA